MRNSIPELPFAVTPCVPSFARAMVQSALFPEAVHTDPGKAITKGRGSAVPAADPDCSVNAARNASMAMEMATGR